MQRNLTPHEVDQANRSEGKRREKPSSVMVVERLRANPSGQLL